MDRNTNVRSGYVRLAVCSQVTVFRMFDRIMRVQLNYERLTEFRTFGAARHASSSLRCIVAMGSCGFARSPCGATKMFGAVVPQNLASRENQVRNEPRYKIIRVVPFAGCPAHKGQPPSWSKSRILRRQRVDRTCGEKGVIADISVYADLG